jgi:hypothetical protein
LDAGNAGNLGWAVCHKDAVNDYDNLNVWVPAHATSGGYSTYQQANLFTHSTSSLAANQISALYRGAGQCSLYVNGTLGTFVANGASVLAVNKLIIGSRFYGAVHQAFWDGWIAELIYYDTALSDPNRTAVESYLKTKWGTP